MVLHSVGIEPAMFSDPDNDLPFTTLDQLVKACVNATGCEIVWATRRRGMQPTAVGLTGLVSMHAPTVRDALQVLSSTLKISNTGVATALDVRGQIASFRVCRHRAQHWGRRPDRRRGDRNGRQHYPPGFAVRPGDQNGCA